MNLDDIDRMLSSEDEILPSSGFVASVLDAVRREASTPPPIPFPWTRAWPVAAAAAIAFVFTSVVIYDVARHSASSSGEGPASASSIESLASVAADSGAHWLVLAVALTLASVAATRRRAAGRV